MTRLIEQQKLLIRLCSERDFRLFFFDISYINKFVMNQAGLEFIKPFNRKSVSHQAEATNILLLNDFKVNLSNIGLNSERFTHFYESYVKAFPYKLDNKFEEYLRFLGYLLYTFPDNHKYLNLKNSIRYEYSLFMSTLKRNRLIEEISFIYKSKIKIAKKFLINPTLVLFNQSNRKNTHFAFYYKDLEAEVTIVEVGKFLSDFLEKNSGQIFSIANIRKVLKIKRNNQIDDLVESGILIRLS